MDRPYWTLSQTIAPVAELEPIALAEAKAQCRIGLEETDEDDLLASLIQVAREVVEDSTERALLTQTWVLALDAFPAGGDAIVIPKPPLQAVTGVTYVDADGATQTWSDYRVTTPAGPRPMRGRLEPAAGSCYPTTLDVLEAVHVTFRCGWTAPELIPQRLRQAQRILVAHWYRHREAIGDGGLVERLLAPFVVQDLA